MDTGDKGTAFVVGATGQIGRAAVRALAEDGWQVRAASRGGGSDAGWPDGVEAVTLDRDADGALATALGDGVDVLVDMVAYGRDHARQLTGLKDRIGSAVVISTGALYEDDQGHSFDTQDEPGKQLHYPVPLPETHRTVAPGDATYATRKVLLERELLASGLPTTLLRAGAIHGPHSRFPREFYFVQRALDRRPVRILAYGGRNRFHPVHVSNLAEMIRLAALRPGARVLNAGDPEVPTVAGISAAIDEVTGVRSELVTVEGPAPVGTVGLTPWSLEHPMVYDMSAAERELGYRAVTGYEQSLPGTVAWLVDQVRERDWRSAFPRMVELYGAVDPFDYAAEDAWLAGRG
ncbi:NAD-dependent epimerase/dehydratase family protein [Streptomyces sp. BR1]|uniref:NAD-dependent epimerase/dehydratase family protein n=1 Tax=Streptomyces sp. BR1 TaxID=1592323 RepID=UPI00402B9644